MLMYIISLHEHVNISNILIACCMLILYRLGQACNHVAALLFFIEHHAGHDKLPTDKTKTSKPMTWNQPPKKEVTPARAADINFVKPSHSDIKENNKILKCRHHQFDPRQLYRRTVQMDSVTDLISKVRKSVPNCGLWASAILGN